LCHFKNSGLGRLVGSARIGAQRFTVTRVVVLSILPFGLAPWADLELQIVLTPMTPDSGAPIIG
jgi:hypothetical protein